MRPRRVVINLRSAGRALAWTALVATTALRLAPAISRGECTGRTTIGGPTGGLSVNCQRKFGRRRRCARTFPGRFMPHSDRARSVGKDPLTTERSQERPGQAFITFTLDVATSDPARPRLPASPHTRRPAYAESVPMPCQCRSAAAPHG